MSLAVVGVRYPNKKGPARRFELELCKPGEPIDLVPEPKNAADPNAIAVVSCRGVQLGYVTAERAPFVRSCIAAGHHVKAIFQGVAATGAWIRVTFDRSEPVIDQSEREQRIATRPLQEFYPDETYPDE